MIPYDRVDEAVPHGGDLDAARRQFPDAIEPFIDLSTGINPNPYPLPRFPAGLFARLPSLEAAATLAATAAQAYGAPSAAHAVLAPGTQLLLPLVAALVPPGQPLPPRHPFSRSILIEFSENYAYSKGNVQSFVKPSRRSIG